MTITTDQPAATGTVAGLAFTADRASLAAAVTFAAKYLPRRPNVPVLSGLLLDVSGGILTVSAFDYDTAAVATCPGHGTADGRMLVRGTELAAAVKAMPKATARRPLTVTLAAAWPQSPAVPDLPEGEQHEYASAPVDGRPWLVDAVCSCGWSMPDVSAYLAPDSHRSHVTTDAPELAVILAARKAAEQPVTGTLTLECDGARFTVGSLPAEDYPALPAVPDLSGTATGPGFARSVARTALAAGADDTLPALTCVQLTAGIETVTMAATDRYRLAVDEMAWTPASVEATGNPVCVPARDLAAFAKLAGKSPAVSLHFGDTHAALSTGDRTVIMRTTDGGNFPRYSALVPDVANIATVATVDAGELASAVKSAGSMLARNVALTLAFAGDSVTLTAAGEDGAGASRTVPCQTECAPLTIAFNPSYLADTLAGFAGAVHVYLQSAAKPALFRAAGDPFSALLMPIRRAS
jgi:DNA polymerase III sliding clamp (beta) subunit (PCNA family)